MYALPKQRRFPLADASHTRLAWDMLNRAKGLSDADRATARKNILKRAKELGIDTSKWKGALNAALDEPPNIGELYDGIQAAKTSSFMADDDGHPNKMPFSGVLAWFDAVSDAAPHGTDGLPVFIPSDVGIAALDSLVGQAVNFVFDGDWASHSPTDKIGVITAAYTGDPEDDGAIPVYIEGFIYALDFSEAAMAIKTNQHLLGFSYETDKTVLADDTLDGTPIKRVSQLGYFTGACILLKASAAYKTTSIAASSIAASAADNLKGDSNLAKPEMKPEHAQAIQALKAAVKHIDAITDSIMAEYGIPDADKDGGVQAAGADSNVQAALTPEGVVQAASTDLTPAVVEGAVTPATVVEPTAVQASSAVQASADVLAQLATLQAQVDALSAEKTALQASAAAQRTSIAYPSLPVAKQDLTTKDEYTTLMAAVDADTTLSVEDRWAKKFELRDMKRKAAL